MISKLTEENQQLKLEKNALDKKREKNVLVDMKEIINTVVHLHSDKRQRSDTYAAALKKEKNVLIAKFADSHNNTVRRK